MPFVERALRWTQQCFTAPASGAYLDAEWGTFEDEEDTFGPEIARAACDEIVWRHPRLNEIAVLLEEE